MTRSGYRKCARCERNRALKFFAPSGRVCKDCQRKRVRFASKSARLQEVYGITLDEYEAILEAQGGVCAICRGKRPVLDVDHDHKVEAALVSDGMPKPQATRLSIRGLVCKRENRRGLPAFGDDIGRLQAAIEYLIDPPASRVLSPDEPF